jgi:hypothetical protein
MNKIEKFIYFATAFFLVVSLSLCSSEQKVELEEVEAKKLPKEEKIPPIISMITEIEEVRGVQKYIYVKIPSDNQWYEEGLFGLIYNDVEKKELVGKFKVTKIHKNFTVGEILELHYPIKPKAIIVIEVDPRYLIK